jgi:hypothetical protein
MTLIGGTEELLTIGVDVKVLSLGNSLHESGQALLHLVDGGYTRRVDIVESRTDQVGVTKLAEGVEEFLSQKKKVVSFLSYCTTMKRKPCYQIALTSLNTDNISVEAFDRVEDN